MKYYTIAKNWKNASDQEIKEFLEYLCCCVPEFNRSEIKVFCVQEWTMGTFIDVYVKFEGMVYHYNIDNDDFIHLEQLDSDSDTDTD